MTRHAKKQKTVEDWLTHTPSSLNTHPKARICGKLLHSASALHSSKGHEDHTRRIELCGRNSSERTHHDGQCHHVLLAPASLKTSRRLCRYWQQSHNTRTSHLPACAEQSRSCSSKVEAHKYPFPQTALSLKLVFDHNPLALLNVFLAVPHRCLLLV